MSTDSLFLHEELMLLAFKDEEGTLVGGTMYSYAIGGAAIADLVMAERIRIEDDPKRPFLDVVDSTPLGDPLLDEWLESMATARKRRRVVDWVTRIASSSNLKHRVAAQLCRRGILRTDEDKVLWIFSRKIYPEVDPRPERELIDRLEAAVFEDSDVDPRTAILAALGHHCGILPAVFDKKRLKQRKERLSRIAEGSIAAGAAAEAIQAMQAAIMVAVLIPTIVTTTVATN